MFQLRFCLIKIEAGFKQAALSTLSVKDNILGLERK